MGWGVGVWVDCSEDVLAILGGRQEAAAVGRVLGRLPDGRAEVSAWSWHFRSLCLRSMSWAGSPFPLLCSLLGQGLCGLGPDRERKEGLSGQGLTDRWLGRGGRRVGEAGPQGWRGAAVWGHALGVMSERWDGLTADVSFPLGRSPTLVSWCSEAPAPLVRVCERRAPLMSLPFLPLRVCGAQTRCSDPSPEPASAGAGRPGGPRGLSCARKVLLGMAFL